MARRARILGLCGVLLPALLSAPVAASAEGFQTFFGNTDVGGFFDRPSASCAATAQSVRYVAQRFRLTQSATCTIYSAQDYDGYIHLYDGSFNPAAPTVNCIAGDDDDNTEGTVVGLGVGTSLLKGLELDAGVYTLVTSAFSNTSVNGGSGSFSNTIHCGTATDTAPSVSNVQPLHGSCGASFTGIPVDQQICLQSNRFVVAVDQITNSATGLATPVRTGSTDTGLFWFYNDRNWEVMVKVLNGCSINNHYWVFIGALTNQGYRVRVADAITLEVEPYTNPLGTRAAAVADTTAFPCS